jgi:predicted MPP superfamily phosphohydrolase
MGERTKFTRRRFLGAIATAAFGLAMAEALAFEPHRLHITHVKLAERPVARFVLWSDFHYSGDEDYANEIVRTINELHPEFVCFLGDLIDNRAYQEAALKYIAKINVPVYGVPGNHDFQCRSPFALNRKTFEATGGGWLVNRIVRPPGDKIELCASAERFVGFIPEQSERPRVLLTHYPITANSTAGKTFTAVLAGHSHGGQVRLPFYGPVHLPRYVGHYDMGLFTTPAGPLYVNVGVGTYRVPARFNCPPEITVVEV